MSQYSLLLTPSKTITYYHPYMDRTTFQAGVSASRRQPKAVQPSHSFTDQTSLVSRLKSIQQNKEIIKARLNKLSDGYIPSHLDKLTPTDQKRRTNNGVFKRGESADSHQGSSKDFGKVQIPRPGMELYRNQVINQDNITSKLKNGGLNKMGINDLNKLRLEIHERQENLLKKKFIYRQTQATAPQNMDKVLDMNQLDINEAVEKANVNIDDYRNPIPKQLLIKELPRIQNNAEQRLRIFKEVEADTSEEAKKYNRRYLAQQNPRTLLLAKEILDDLINQAVGYYENLSNKLNLNGPGWIMAPREGNKDDLIIQGVYSKILSKILKQFHKETHQEVSGLQDLADKKLEQIFGETYNNPSKKWESKVISNYEYKLNYRQQDNDSSSQQNQSQYSVSEYESLSKSSTSFIRPPKKKNQPQPITKKKPGDRYKSKVPHSTSSFTNSTTSEFSKKGKKKTQMPKPITQQSQSQGTEEQIELPFKREEQKYFDNVEVDFVEIIDRTYDSKRLLIENGIYLVSPKHIKNIREENIMPNPYNKQLLGYKKFNAYWAVYCQNQVTVMHPWHQQRLSVNYGSRPKRLAGKIASIEFYPITTLLGNVTAIMIGYENGIILKYNFNRDPLSGDQSGDAFFEPLIPHKVLDEPPIPSEFKNQISFPKSKGQQAHCFREFFDFHDKKIIGIHFYSIVQFISVDVSMTCAMWNCLDDELTPIDTFVIDDSQSYYRANNNKSTNIDIDEDGDKMYNRLFNTAEGLANQVYNNPEDGYAYYLPQSAAKSGVDSQLWKVTYKKQNITKIVEEHFDQRTNTPQALSACLWNSNLFIMTCRQHPIDKKYNTYRVICWNIAKKRKKNVLYELHLEKGEEQPIFLISDSVFDNHENSCPALFMMNPGRVMMYSLLTGQLIRNVGDPNSMDDPLGFYHFATAANTAIVLVGDSGIHRMTFQDKNSPSAKEKYLKEIRGLVQKFLK